MKAITKHIINEKIQRFSKAQLDELLMIVQGMEKGETYI
jgi:hypothetical protein